MSSFFDKMKKYVDKGVEVSKDAFSKAGEKAQDLGEKGVLKIEIKQLESKAAHECMSLGTKVYELLVTGKQESVTADDGQISGILSEITRLKDEVAKREAELKSGKES